MVRETEQDRMFDVINKGLMFLALVIVLYPLIYVVSASVSDPVYVNSGQMWFFPRGFTLEGYKRVFRNVEIWVGYRNTIFYTVAGTIINLIVTIPAAYSLSRRDFVGRNVISGFFVFTMFFSGGLIPLYLLVKDLNMIDKPLAVLLPGAASVWNIVITRTYFQTSIPRELEEAAEIDGCSNMKLFFSIILPLSAPIIAVMALFYGVGHWNEYFGSMIFLKRRSLYPLQLFLREILIVNQMMRDSKVFAGAEAEAMAQQARIADIVKYSVMIVSTLPVILAYPFLQRYFVKGIMVGSLKG